MRAPLLVLKYSVRVGNGATYADVEFDVVCETEKLGQTTRRRRYRTRNGRKVILFFRFNCNISRVERVRTFNLDHRYECYYASFSTRVDRLLRRRRRRRRRRYGRSILYTSPTTTCACARARAPASSPTADRQTRPGRHAQLHAPPDLKKFSRDSTSVARRHRRTRGDPCG